MIARIAWGLARSPLPEHRWRRVAVPMAAMVALLLVLAATSVVVLVRREAARAERRIALPAVAPAPTDLFIHDGFDDWRGEQFGAAWIEPAGDAPPVLPPGMAALPAPGQAVVSPALDQLADREPALDERYPNRLVLGTEGVRGGDELFAYIRPAAGRNLTGYGVQRVRGFGRPPPGGFGWELGVPTVVAVVPIVQGVLGLLVLPGLLVLAVGGAAASSIRDRRFAVLRTLGAPRRTTTALAVTETLLLALPGLAVAVLLWAVATPRLDRVPLVGRGVVPGDLALPWWLLAVLLGAGVTATALAAALATVGGRRGSPRPRPVVGRAVLSPLRLAPLALALGLATWGSATGGYDGQRLVVGGMVVSLAALPLVLPIVVRAVGAELSGLPSVPALLAGRLLQWDAVRGTRPFAAFGALVVLALGASAYIARTQHDESPEPSATGPSAAIVEWASPRPDDPARLAAALGAGLVAPLRFGEGAPAAPTLVVGASCWDLTAYLPGTFCRPEAPFELPPEAVGRLAALVPVPGPQIELAPAAEVATGPGTADAHGSVLVLADLPAATLHERAGTAAMRVLPAPQVTDRQTYAKRESPLTTWIVGGIVAALAALAAGCLLALVDRLLATRGPRRRLLSLGVTPRRLATLEAWLFAVPYGAVLAVSFAAGLALSTLLGRIGHVPTPWAAVGVIAGLSLVVGTLGSAAVALFGVSGAQADERLSP